ncbi:GNAT family N-acetyltransferase, partial [Enterococcus lactis]|uniref:GNAT family N-acetyltransferase n=1 Tax=Enterococcus lactis TaxID=357441 RepID=UPI0022E54EAB
MIRFARKEDAPEIAPLILVILKDMELPFLKQTGEQKNGYTDEEEAIIDQPLVPILEKYQLDASTRLFIDKETFPNEWYLDSISVSEDFRGQGIGSRLLEALPKLAKKANRSVIGLSVDEKNPKAKKLYERHGFKVVGQRMISGHLYDHMQK